MSERAPYSRVYWTIVDDPKFAGIYDDDHHLAAWLRMLLVHDQAHPASGQIPSNCRVGSVKALVDAGLVDRLGSRYKIHGLDAERDRRREAASNRPVPKRGPTATQTGPKREAEGQQGLDEDKTRQGLDEHLAREGLPNLDAGAMRELERRTGRTWSQAGQKQLSEFDELVGVHGLEKVLSAMDRIADGQTMTARQLVWGAMKVLEPMIPVQSLLKEDADAERQEERERTSRRGVDATQEYLRKLRSVGSGESA